MMNIMDRLTDKEHWHKKVFDEEIVSKWRKEALELPDDVLWKQATGDKAPRGWTDQQKEEWGQLGIPQLRGIMSTTAFEFVSG